MKKILLTLVMTISVFGIQFGTLTSAHALGSADLNINIEIMGGNTGIQINVCNSGPSGVSSFTLNTSLTNISIGRIGVFPAGTNASDKGTFDKNTMTWSGLVESAQCVDLLTEATPTASAGQSASLSADIVSSVLDDSSPNVDPNPGNESASLTPFTIEAEPDISLETRLKTTGTISSSSIVTYEAKISNLGPGIYHDNGFNIIGFAMPEGASLDGVTDADPSDGISPTNCTTLGPIANLGFTALSSYTGDVAFCELHFVNGLTAITPNMTFPFEFNIVAGPNLAAGSANVLAVVEGADRDTAKLWMNIAFGENPTSVFNNNIQTLAYDPNALRVTVSRCTGQGSTTTNGTACFNVAFNKKPYAPSFTSDDIVLSSGESVSEFTQLNDTTWKVVISGIKPGSTFALTLKQDSVLDYSAVQNDVKVLGENTVRYELLPATGTKADWLTPLGLLMLGLVLLMISKNMDKRNSGEYHLHANNPYQLG